MVRFDRAISGRVAGVALDSGPEFVTYSGLPTPNPPMKVAFTVLAIIVVIASLPLLLPSPSGNRGDAPVTGLPWQIEPQADGTARVFGLTLGTSTLENARQRFGEDHETAIVAAPGESGSLEIYFPDVTLGAVTGKLIVTADLAENTLQAMRQRAGKGKYMQSSTRKASLADTDLAVAYAARIRGLAFVPSVNLDEAMILQRFGPPAERLRGAENMEHFLYPERGLDVVLNGQGKELIQYIAPRDFARLREPLVGKVHNDSNPTSPR